jgi:uncharacterized protein YkwD
MEVIIKALPLIVGGALATVGCVGMEPGLDEHMGGDEERADVLDPEQGTDDTGDAIGTSAAGEQAEDPGEVELAAYCDDVAIWSSTWISFESQVISLVNQRRAAGATCGGNYFPPAPALTLDHRLRCSARKHSKDMAVNNFFSHTGSNGSKSWDRMESAGYDWTYAAENIAAGYSTPASVVNGWMTSSGHCKNIMRKKAKHTGVGYYYASSSSYKHYWTQNFGAE